MTRDLRRLLPILLLAITAGCASDQHLVFTTSTKFGVDITAADGSTTGLMFGYKRFEGAYVPVDPNHVDDEGNPDMPSLLAVLDLENGWLSGVDVFQLFATGTAAELAARDPDGLAKVIGGARKDEGGDDNDDDDDDDDEPIVEDTP